MGMSSYVMDEEEKQFNHLCQIFMNKGMTAAEATAAALDELDRDEPDQYNREEI